MVHDNKLDVVIVVGDKASSSHVIAQTQLMLSLSDYLFRRTSAIAKGNALLASEVNDIEHLNVISLGNACINPISARILGNPEPCNNLKLGEATIEVYKSRNNKAHIVLNAYSDEGVKKAAEVLSRYHNYNLKGNRFVLEVDEKESDVQAIVNNSLSEKFNEKSEVAKEEVNRNENIPKKENDSKISSAKFGNVSPERKGLNNEMVQNETKSLEIENITEEKQYVEKQKIEGKTPIKINNEEPSIITRIIIFFIDLFK